MWKKKMMLDEKKGKITKRERKRKENKRKENKTKVSFVFLRFYVDGA
jgi:hypothetical protein